MDWIWILISALLLVDIAIVIIIFLRRRRRGFSDEQIGFFEERMTRLEQIVSRDPQFVVMEADKLLDKALTLKGYQGTLAEKLHASETLFRDIQSLWRAHKLRNRLAHEVGVAIAHGEARQCLRAIKNALHELAIL